MFKQTTIVLLLLLSCVPAVLARNIGGADLAETIRINETDLVLNGAGIREKYFVGIDIYAAGLYLKAPSKKASAIINADDTMALKIKILTDLVTAKKFQEAMRTGFEESTNGNTAPFKKEMALLPKAFSGEIGKGDLFDLIYIKDAGVRITKNGQNIVTIPGLPFKKAFWGIWLGNMAEKQLQTLRDQLLGKQ